MRNIQCLRLLMILALFIVALTSGCVYTQPSPYDPYMSSGVNPYMSSGVNPYRIQREQLKAQYDAQFQAIDAQEAVHPSTRSSRIYYKNQRRVLRNRYNSELKTINERERYQRKMASIKEREYRKSPAGIYQESFRSGVNRTVRRIAREAGEETGESFALPFLPPF